MRFVVDAISTLRAWIKAHLGRRPELFGKRGGVLVIESRFENKTEAAIFKAQFDTMADRVLWAHPDVDAMTYFGKDGKQVDLYRRRGMIPTPQLYATSEGEAES